MYKIQFTPAPPEEIAQLMQFIAEKAKNVISPMNVKELCRQFKENTGSLVSVNGLKDRVRRNRHKIHEMNEFDMVTKVKMIFALSAPIDEELLVELKKVADVDVDDQQRVTRYKQRDGRLELSGVKKGNQRNIELIQLLAEMSKKTSKPIAVKPFLREFKANTGCTDSIVALEHRYQRLRETIYQSTGIDRNTKIKMMFISNAKLPEEIIEELRKDADVEVDGAGRITKYKSKDGSLELEGNHGMSSIKKAVHSDRWEIIYQKANINESEEDDGEETDCQKDYERKRIDLVRFLIKRTKSATSPLSITQLAKNYQAEFKKSYITLTNVCRIQRLRQRIYETNQFDTATKVKMLFSLSASVDTKLLKELRKDAIVELDETQKIKKYKSNDGSLELERNYSRQTKVIAASAKRTRIDSNSSESTGEKDAQSTRSSQSSVRIQKGRKRGRVAYSSSEDSEENDDDEESLKQKDNWSMDFDANNADDFDYDPSNYELQRIVHYKQKNGGLELSAKYSQISTDQGEQRGREFVQFLAEKSKTIDKPIADTALLREFKEKSGYTDSIESLRQRYLRLKNTIFQLTEIDKNTRIKMMLISHATLSYEIFQELQKDADVEVDKEGRITKYKSNDGSLELEGDHSVSARLETAREENKRQRIAAILKRKRARDVSEKYELLKVQNCDTS